MTFNNTIARTKHGILQFAGTLDNVSALKNGGSGNVKNFWNVSVGFIIR